MLAYEFLAHDMCGLTLDGVTDDGTCLWIGKHEQFANAEMQTLYFEEHGHFFDAEDQRHSKHYWDETHPF